MKPSDISTDLTVEQLREFVSYDKKSGKFLWLQSNNQTRVDKRAGWLNPKTGYVILKIFGHKYMAHRLAWLCVTGGWPKDRLDHKDGNRSNNSWNNLREASDAQNAANRKVHSNNKLGAKGVSQHVGGKFHARIGKDGKVVYLGLFKKLEDAKTAYANAARAKYTEFARVK